MPAASGFRIGAEVEVRSTEEGLQGSWYEATVTRSHLHRRFYHVQYATLLADDHPSRPLIETLPASHLRPRAPRLAPAAGYALEDLVDAFHNDGWWPGIVSATDGSSPPGRYTVCFPSSREVFEFAPSEIRPRLQWRHAHWLPHENLEEAMFREGEQVEVSGDKENYGTTWFMATVVKVIAKTIYLVEYRNPKSDGGHDLLREFLDVQYVRPVPPSTTEGKHFALHEEIEVCVCGVWMVGVVLKIVGNSRYTVKLRSPKEEELELSHSEMRRIRIWINEQCECVTQRSGRPSLAGKKPDEPLSVSSPRRSKRKMRRGPTSEGKSEALLSNKKLKNGDPSDQLRMEIDPRTPTVDKEPLAALQEFESPPTGLVTLVPSLHVDEGLHESLLVNDLCVEQRWPKFNNTTESEVLGETPSNCTGKLPTTQNVNHSLSPREIGNFVLPAERGNSKDVCGNSVCVMKRAKKLACREVPDVIDVKRHSKAETKKKRSRPRKQSTESIVSMNVACTELEQPKRTSNGVADSKDTNKGTTLSNRDLLHNDASNTKANMQVGQQVARDLKQMVSFTENVQGLSSFANGLNDTAIEVETRDLPPSLKEDRALAKDLTPQMASFSQDAIGISASFLIGKLQDVANFTNGLNDTANGVENRSLSSSPKEDCTVARSNSYDPGVGGTSRFGSMNDIEGVEAEIISHLPESADVTDKSQTSSMPPSRSVNVDEMGLTDPSPIGSTRARTLPFVKHSSLWEEIDSMEIFHIMPQKPHFHALEQQYSREFREGMAIGLMVTFANLEASMRKLDVFDSQASFEERLKTLKQLEDNGFDIQSLQSRIQKLLDKRNITHELQNKENRMKDLMFQRKYENDCIETEKIEVDKRIKEVEKHLASLSERRKSLLVQQLELQKTLQAMQEAYLCAERQFHTIVASLW